MVYEGISTTCFNCGVYGHVKELCPYNSISADKDVQTNDEVAVDTNDSGGRTMDISDNNDKSMPRSDLLLVLLKVRIWDLGW